MCKSLNDLALFEIEELVPLESLEEKASVDSRIFIRLNSLRTISCPTSEKEEDLLRFLLEYSREGVGLKISLMSFQLSKSCSLACLVSQIFELDGFATDTSFGAQISEKLWAGVRGVWIGVGAVVRKALGGVGCGVGAGVLRELDHARAGVSGRL